MVGGRLQDLFNGLTAYRDNDHLATADGERQTFWKVCSQVHSLNKVTVSLTFGNLCTGAASCRWRAACRRWRCSTCRSSFGCTCAEASWAWRRSAAVRRRGPVIRRITAGGGSGGGPHCSRGLASALSPRSARPSRTLITKPGIIFFSDYKPGTRPSRILSRVVPL